MQNTLHKVHEGSLLFSFKINKLNYNLYNRRRKNSHILPNLYERFVCCFTFAVRSQ